VAARIELQEVGALYRSGDTPVPSACEDRNADGCHEDNCGDDRVCASFFVRKSEQ
jgi:hypothetical protein